MKRKKERKKIERGAALRQCGSEAKQGKSKSKIGETVNSQFRFFVDLVVGNRADAGLQLVALVGSNRMAFGAEPGQMHIE